MSITLDQAEKLSHAAKAKATEIGVPMNIAIVDEGANLVCFHRMDNAWLGSVDISIKKAKTARFFDMNTGVIGTLSQPGGPLYNIEHSNGGPVSSPGRRSSCPLRARSAARSTSSILRSSRTGAPRRATGRTRSTPSSPR